jgi:hypothetical protein
MRHAGVAALGVIAAAAAITLYVAFTQSSHSATPASAVIPTRTAPPPTAAPTPPPTNWIDGIVSQRGHRGDVTLISCLDTDGNGVVDADDDAGLSGISIALTATACADPVHHADFYTGTRSDTAAYTCDAPHAPAMIVVAASAGSDILASKEGESLGLIDVLNQLQARASVAGIATEPIISASAVFGAEEPQTSMERWIERYLAAALRDMPCLRAVVIGHSHGGVIVTAATATLDEQFGDRMFGVLVDRTDTLYDRHATEMPSVTPLINFFQMNEGWHGVSLGLPNVTDIDASTVRAPVAPSDGGGGLALVSHKTLDDAPAAQQGIVDSVMAWLQRPAPTP